MFVVGQGKVGVRGEENPALPVRGKRGVGHLARFHAITVAGMRRDDYSSALMRRLVISRTAARMTKMEPPTYRMVVPMPPVERRTNHHYFFVPSAQRTVPACLDKSSLFLCPVSTENRPRVFPV